MDHGIFLHGLWDTCLPYDRTTSGGAGLPDRDVISGRPSDECQQNSGYGLPTMPNGGWLFRVQIRAADDQGRPT